MSAELTGTQKVAIVLMAMGTDYASGVLREFAEDEAEEIASEIVRLRKVDPDTLESTLNEFYDLVVDGRVGSRGGRDLATGLLEGAFGEERANGLMNRVTNSMAGKSFEFLDEADPGQIVSLLDGEMAQTIALVLAHLSPARASAVLSGFPQERRTEVARNIASMAPPTPEAIAAVAQSLKARSASVVTHRAASEVIGGVQPLVDIINRSDAATERLLLGGLEETDPELAEEVRSKLLTFADIAKLDNRDIQQVLRGIDVSVLALALRGATDTVAARITENMSERNRDLLADETGMLSSSTRKSQVEEAQADVVRAIRELADAGTITVHRGDDEDLL